MTKYISYRKINEILKSIQENSWYKDWDFLEIEIKELVDLWFIEITNFDIIIDDFNNCKIKNEWEKFLNSYKIKSNRIEYFFKDFPFLWALIIWAIWWFVWGIIWIL